MSTFRHHLTLTVFGESHGSEIGMTLSGIPAGKAVDMEKLRAFLARRAPGRGAAGTSSRSEEDIPEFRTGLQCGVTTGEPITAVIRNTDARPGDYAFSHTPRPGHADYTAWVKGGEAAVLPGGGRFSGRLTAPICVAGGICRQILEQEGVEIISRIVSLGSVTDPAPLTASTAEKPFPAVSETAARAMQEELEDCRRRGDSVGAVVECQVLNLPAGLGDCLFDGLESTVSALAFGIPGVKGVEFGAGFSSARMHGSEHNDPFAVKEGRIVTETNHAGGLLGGITTGMPLVFRCAFKPTASIAMEQETVELRAMEPTRITVSGRHDACIALRGLAVAEAVAAIGVMDQWNTASPRGASDDLQQCRREIDAIDGEMLRLFTRRMAVAGEIARYKAARGLPVRDPVREEQKLRSVAEQVPPELSPSARALYEEIFSLTRGREQELMEEKKC